MRVVIQRVKQASVRVEGETVGFIKQGFCIFVGFEREEKDDDLEWLSKKIVQMRIFSDDNGKMNLSIEDIGGDILLISQFTLHAKTKKGNRPSFIQAAPPAMAENLYTNFGKMLEKHLEHGIQYGRFGAMMEVDLINDGPVTIIMDSKERK